MLKLVIFSLAALQIHTAVSQCLNRQANFLYNRPETIIEAPLNPLLLPPTVIENQNFATTTYPNPTTIITDCTPSVCQNLVNTIQLMIVCNLLRNTKEGSELAAQIASSPIVNELMTSPVFSCGCSNPLSKVPLVSPNLMTSLVSPNFLPPNLNSRLPVATNVLSNVNTNALMGNIMNMLS